MHLRKPTNRQTATKLKLVLLLHVGPWLIVYVAIAYVWLFVFGAEEFLDVGRILVCVAAFFHALIFLSCQWSVHVKCALTCSVQTDPYKAELVKVFGL